MPPMDRRHIWIFGLILTLAIVINLIGLTDYPAPYCDEAAESAYGYSYIKYGDFSQAFLAREQGITTTRPLLGYYYYSGLGIWLSVFGPTYVANRLYAFTGWLLLIGTTFLAGKKAYNELTGALASLLAAISLSVYQLSHINRPEIWVMATAMLILYLTLVIEDQPAKWPYILLGLAVVQLPTEVYLSGMFFSVALGILVVWRSIRPTIDIRKLGFFALGSLLGIVFFVVLHLASEPSRAMDGLLSLITLNCAGCSSLSAFSFSSVVAKTIATTLASLYILFIRDLRGLTLPFYFYTVVGLGTAFYLRRDGDKTLLIVWGISAGLFVLLPYKSNFYVMVWDPLLAILAAASLTRLTSAMADRIILKTRRLPAPAVLSLLAASPLLIFNLGSQIWFAARFMPRNVPRYQQEVQRAVPAGASVMADPLLWYVFVGRNSFTSEWYWYVGTDLIETPTLEYEIGLVMDDLDIDFAIDDGALGCTKVSTPFARALSRYLAANCTLTRTIDDPYFGANGDLGQGEPTRIYDCRTSGESARLPLSWRSN